MSGKKILALAVGILLLLLIVIGYLIGYQHFWSIWQIPMMPLSFADLRNLTGGAESITKGYDPLYYNPQDPWNRPLNQPRLVQYILGFLQINQSHTVLIGIIFGLLFLTGVFIAFKKLDKPSALIISLLIVSPAAALGIERGNHDLLMFFLVAVALALIDYTWLAMAILLLASFIKLFPVFAILSLWKSNGRKNIFFTIVFMGSFIFYIIYNRADWAQVFSSTQKGHYLWAYGVMTYDLTATPYSYIPLGALMLSTIMFYISSIRLQGWSVCDNSYIASFRAGAGIYLGTFLLGNSWAYRLIFLIFIVPQLVVWIKTDPSRKLVAVITLLMVITSSCPTWINSGILDEIFNWLLFTTLFYLMMSSLPFSLQKILTKSPIIINK
jgi:hypothetical protein